MVQKQCGMNHAMMHRSADFLDTVFLRTYTYKTISRYKVVGADPTDIDIYSVWAPAYLWRPLVTYYSIWSVEYKESISIKMVIFIKTQMFFNVRGVGASPLV